MFLIELMPSVKTGFLFQILVGVSGVHGVNAMSAVESDHRIDLEPVGHQDLNFVVAFQVKCVLATKDCVLKVG